MENFEKVYEVLDKLDIKYETVEHIAVFTVEEAKKVLNIQNATGTKTLFLTNRNKKSYYLLAMDDEKRLDMKKLASVLGEKELRFASEEKLMSKLSLIAGSVTIFGLINNKEKDIKVCIDNDLNLGDKICFHPNVNTKTTIIKTKDMYRFLEFLGYDYKIIDI